MEARSRLIAAAVAEHRHGAEKFGRGALVLGILTLVFSAGESIVLNWLAFGSAVAAFFSFCLWAGESKSADLASQYAENVPPPTPEERLSRDDVALVRAYGNVLERHAGSAVIRAELLPASKRRLKRVLVTAIKCTESAAEAVTLQEGYLRLSAFQPIPGGGAALAQVVAAGEYTELLLELAAITLRAGGTGEVS